MFIREALARTMSDRMAWFWMLFEPIAMIVLMVLIRTVAMGSVQHIGGAEFIPWIVTGLFGFFLFRENMLRPIGAIDANKGLLAYRQVKPIDSVMVRCYLEGLLKSFIFCLFILAGVLLDIGLLPAEPLVALWAWFSLWCLGGGAGLVFSALAGLVPEVARVLRIISMPLLIISGVVFPLNFVPHDLLHYVMWNPIVHGLETLRAAFFALYQPVHGTSLLYLWYWALTLMTLGLMLHVRFESRLKRQ
ncbi:ABC transporter permease [Marinobacterium mangrovicola]|nr:ABC transporter permease [Marinobacterium mangrovicola]